MGKQLAWGFTILLCAGVIRAEPISGPKSGPKEASAVQEIWEAASLDNGRAGYFRTTFQTLDVDGQKVVRSRQALNLTVKRFREVVQLRMQSGTDETADGKVLGVFMQMEQSGGPLVLSGTVKERVSGEGMKERFLAVEVDKGRIRRELPWNEKVIGLQAQERLFQGKPFKPGDTRTFQSFEPSLNTVVTVRAKVHEPEEVELAGAKKKLFRAVLASDKIEVPGASVQLPPITVWMDDKGTILRRQVEIPGLGKILLVRTTKDAALAQGQPAELTDIGLKHLIYVKRRIDRSNDTTAAVYRITIVDDAKPDTAILQDDRQKIRKTEGQVVELHVQAIRTAPAEGDGKAGEEFLQSCHYIDSDNEKVQELAREAVRKVTDPWEKARRIESYVHRRMRIDPTVPFGPASRVAGDLRGDCRQYALLTAAMCRAAGVPSRTAIGLIYAEDRQGRPMFGFHMWVEVFVRGAWVGLDGTLGEGTVGAAHIKVTDHSWHDVQSVTPLLPLQRVLGKMKIEVVSVTH
jgi:hypothetical protein